MKNRRNQKQSFGIDIVFMLLIVAVLAFFWWAGSEPDAAKQLLGGGEPMGPFWQRAMIVVIVFPVILWVFKASRR
jgi:hypothetical protein